MSFFSWVVESHRFIYAKKKKKKKKKKECSQQNFRVSSIYFYVFILKFFFTYSNEVGGSRLSVGWHYFR